MELIAPKLESLPPAQRALWPALAEVPRQFVLYGGTGLALQLGHRDSVDFDFFSSLPLDKAALRSSTFLRRAEVTQDEENTLSVAVPGAPGVGGKYVNLSFFGNLSLGRVGEPAVCREHGLKVASLLDIAGLKAAVVQQRAEFKDYTDVAALLTAGVPLEKMTGAAAALYPGQFEPSSTLLALNYFGDGDLSRLSPQTRAQLSTAVRGFRGMERLARASDAMTLTAAEAVPALEELRARFTLASSDQTQRAELVERAGWIGVELSGSQGRAEQAKWKTFGRELLERRPGLNVEAFVTRALGQAAKPQNRDRERESR